MLRCAAARLLAPKTPRQILGVGPHATADEVKERFRVLARQHHPDMATGDANKFREINAAYSIIRAEMKAGGTPDSASSSSKADGGSTVRNKKKNTQARPSSGATHMPPGAAAEHDESYYEANAERSRWSNDRAAFKYRLHANRGTIALCGVSSLVFALLFYRYYTAPRKTRGMIDAENGTSSSASPEVVVSDEDLSKLTMELGSAVSSQQQPQQRKEETKRMGKEAIFDSFEHYLEAFDTLDAGERKVTLHQFVADAVDELLVPERCVFVRKFNSDKDPGGYDAVVDALIPQVQRTKWINIDVADAASLVLSGASRVVNTNPHRARWTFVEYRRVDPVTRTATGPAECVAAIRNDRTAVSAAQRLIVSGHESLQPPKLRRRREDLSCGRVLAKELVAGGIPPIRESLK
jgi:hypothetical protein